MRPVDLKQILIWSIPVPILAVIGLGGGPGASKTNIFDQFLAFLLPELQLWSQHFDNF